MISGKGRPQGRPTPAEVAEQIIDEVNELDRDWFLSHPGQRAYERPVRLGEFWPTGIWLGGHVRVIELAPGVRTRQPLGGAR